MWWPTHVLFLTWCFPRPLTLFLISHFFLVTPIHHAIQFSLNIEPAKCVSGRKSVYNFKRVNWDKLTQNFSTKLPTAFHSSWTVNFAWELWLSTFFVCLNANVSRCIIRGGKYHPWITAEVVKEINKRDRLFKKCTQNPGVERWERYRLLRNKVKKLISNAYKSYIWNLGGNVKKLWKFVRYSMGSSTPKSFVVNGSPTTDPVIIANAFISHFRLNFSPLTGSYI